MPYVIRRGVISGRLPDVGIAAIISDNMAIYPCNRRASQGKKENLNTLRVVPPKRFLLGCAFVRQMHSGLYLPGNGSLAFSIKRR